MVVTSRASADSPVRRCRCHATGYTLLSREYLNSERQASLMEPVPDTVINRDTSSLLEVILYFPPFFF